MDPATPEGGSRKRPFSLQSSSADLSQDKVSVVSQKTYTAARYRFVGLRQAQMFIRAGPPPEEVQPQIKAIFQRSVCDERKHDLSHIANRLCNRFIRIIERTSSEDDCMEPIHAALSAIDSSEKFDYAINADWDQSLKPIPPAAIDYTFLTKPNDKANHSMAMSIREQQGHAVYASPEASKSTISPPSLPAIPKAVTYVETPRPDITAGLRDSTVVDALVARSLEEFKASTMLETLQDQQVLCSSPVHDALQIRFSHMVVEGKSYSTGMPIFEAQNQTAVSGSYMTNLQHMLTDLTERASLDPIIASHL